MSPLVAHPAVRIIVPLALAGLLAWHPTDPTVAIELRGQLARWTTIHLGLLIALPLLVLQLLRTLRGIDGPVAQLARVAAVTAAAFYAAFESLVGLGTGVLVRLSEQLPDELAPGAIELTQRWWEVPSPIPAISTVAIVAWVVALTAAAVAHHRAGASRVTVWALLAAGWLFAAGHPGLTGAGAMVALAVALATWRPAPVTGDAVRAWACGS